MKYFIYCRKSTEDSGKQIQSIEDQEKILKQIAERRGLEVVDNLKESKSAKAPGRTAFNYMIDQIHQGKAQGIICWKIDRLARNPVDGGTINWMLQQGVIQKIITSDRDYHPTDNVLMMSMEFGMANQFILDLGKNTKRGMKSKCEKGWFPGVAPLGYLNNKYCEKGERSIINDELRFPLVRKAWDLMLTGRYSVGLLCEEMNKWGLTTVKRKRSGGNSIGKSTLYNMLINPFYCGEFEWDGDLYEGRHEPMITRDEFNHVQKLLKSRGKPRIKKKDFAFTGLIQCGECGCMITAQDKTKFIKSEGRVRGYTYYHCTHRKKNYKCRQGSVERKKLEEQIRGYLDEFTIEDEFIDWIKKYLHEFVDREVVDRESIVKNLKAKLTGGAKRLDNLIKLKIKGDLITDEEFKLQKNQLMDEKRQVLEELNKMNDRQDNWIHSAEKAVDFLKNVKDRFTNGTLKEKRLILSTLGSNLILKDGKLSIQANGVYQPLQKGIQQTNKLNIRLELVKGQLNKTKKEHQNALYSIWLPRLDSNQ